MSGAEKLREASSPHVGHGALDGAEPMGKVSSKRPSRPHR